MMPFFRYYMPTDFSFTEKKKPLCSRILFGREDIIIIGRDRQAGGRATSFIDSDSQLFRSSRILTQNFNSPPTGRAIPPREILN
jgi:hypothetical protein